MKAKDKRRFLMISVIMILVIILISEFLPKLFGKTRNQEVTVSNSKGNNSKNLKADYLPIGDDGNITYEENEYFKKFTVHCNNEQKEIKYDENEKSINITFDNSVNLKLNTATSKEIDKTEITKEDKSSNVLNIKKYFDKNNFVEIDSSDKENIIVLVSKIENPFKYKVMLDPGHGGIDNGMSIGNIKEKDITLKIAKHMVNNLRFNGCEVILSRYKDELNALMDISNSANVQKVDVLISLHINAFVKDGSVSGVGTYYTQNGWFDEDRLRLAKVIQKNVVKDDNWVNRGLFKDKLKVLSYSQVPCALVECGFLTNPSDLAKVTSEGPISNLAKNIGNGILEFLKTK